MERKYKIRKDQDHGWALYLRTPQPFAGSNYVRITPWLGSQASAIRLMDYRERQLRSR